MPAIMEYAGLCMTCNNIPTCPTREDEGRPKWYCEQFDDYLLPTTRNAANAGLSGQADRHVSSAESDNESGHLAGLCINCEERHICKSPKPGGGIWHCEEYR